MESGNNLILNYENTENTENTNEIRDFFDIKKLNSNTYDIKYLEKRISSLQLTPEQTKTLYRFCDHNKIETDDQKIQLLLDIRKRQYKHIKSGEYDSNDHTRFNDALENIRYGKKISDIFLDSMDNDNEKLIIKTIYKYIDEGRELSEKIDLTGFYIDEDVDKALYEKNYLLSLEEIPGILGIESDTFFNNVSQKYREKIKELIENAIERGVNPDKLCEEILYPENENLYNTYLQYKTIEKRGKNKEFSNSDLKKEFKVILKILGYKVSNVDLKALQEEEERQKIIENENAKRIKNYLDRKKARNEKIPNNEPKKGTEFNKEKQPKSSDINNASGSEIASNLDLSGIKIEENNQFDEVNKEMVKYPAFDLAWKEFISSAGDVSINGQNVSIKSLITHIDMRKIYNMDTDTINEDALTRILSRIYKKPDGSPNITKEEISAVKEKLRGFSSQFKEHIKKLSNKSGEMKDKVQNIVKTHAMGSVIDNIRGIMSEIQNDSKNGFKLTQEPPVKIEGDYLILPGEMNGTKIDVRYNIETGDLFMNTLITQQGNDTIIIGENGNYKKVGELKNFINIMNEYYRPEPIDTPEKKETNNYKPINPNNFPKNADNNHFRTPPIHTNRREREKEKRTQRKECFRETLNQDVQLIGETIKNEFEKKELINSTITKFMKTFNIIPNEGKYKNIQIKEGCSLFNLFQTISQSTPSDLKAFEEYIKKTTEFSCLKWGENTRYPKIEKLLEKEYHNNGIKKDIQDSMLAYNGGEKIKPEDNENNKTLFDSNFKSNIIDTIIKYCISGEAPNQRIDTNKIKESLNDLNQRDEEVSIENMRDFT